MFITFEGIEGSGKTTQVRRLESFLADRGYRCLLTREPGGTAVGEKIRGILLDPANREICPQAELLLYIADRTQHVAEIIRPALARGQTVICDRFADASVVYQGMARGLDTDMVISLHHLILGHFSPDLTFLLDLPVETGLSRAWKRIDAGVQGAAESRFEEEALAFHQRVRRGYLDLARREPRRFVVIDASPDAARVTSDIIAAMKKRINTDGKSQ
jgi:dTMP kinase